jgi:hypothetical protein
MTLVELGVYQSMTRRQYPQEVHLCCYSSQPNIQIACDLSFTTPAWNGGTEDGEDESVYRSDDGRLYTFDHDRTTCKACLTAGARSASTTG